MWDGRVRRPGIRRWARRGGGALVHHSWTISSRNSLFQVSSSGPWQGRAGRVRRAGMCGRRASLPACCPTDMQAGPPRWRGAHALLRGSIAVNNQCFKLRVRARAVSLRRQSTCQSVMGLGTGRRSGQESGKDEIWTITQRPRILGQGTGAPSTVSPYRRRQSELSEEANLRRATLDKGGGARP